MSPIGGCVWYQASDSICGTFRWKILAEESGSPGTLRCCSPTPLPVHALLPYCGYDLMMQPAAPAVMPSLQS